MILFQSYDSHVFQSLLKEFTPRMLDMSFIIIIIIILFSWLQIGNEWQSNL